MKFEDVLIDIEKMVGLVLPSIKKGSEITVTDVDVNNQRIELITSKGIKKSRPFSELNNVWNYLCKEPAIHVDTVLSGSGSSRNQPETIFANLPYVEWFIYKSKKHITLVNEPTHDYGTLRKMDDILSEEVKERLEKQNTKITEPGMVVVISNDIREYADQFENLTGLVLKPITLGVYGQMHSGNQILVVSSQHVPPNVNPGVYIVIKAKSIPPNGIPIWVQNREFYVLNNGTYVIVTV